MEFEFEWNSFYVIHLHHECHFRDNVIRTTTIFY